MFMCTCTYFVLFFLQTNDSNNQCPFIRRAKYQGRKRQDKMTSAFEEAKPEAVEAAAAAESLADSSGEESETEDEEVAMNCVGGFRGIDDSDMNTTGSSDEEEDLEDE